MPQRISGPSADALNSLSSEQIAFLKSLPKAELHAHLNGCIPLACLQELAASYAPAALDSAAIGSEAVSEGIEKLRQGVQLDTISDFFGLFTAIYALTSTSENLARATRAVIEDFMGGGNSGRQCAYLELRSTPKRTEHMSRLQYVETVLDEIEWHPAEEVALIVSLDRRMSPEEAQECVDIAIRLKEAGRRVVGVDICGDPLAGDMKLFGSHFKRAKDAGLGITLHIAETESNSPEDTLQLLSFKPDRLGHATFLDDEAKQFVLEHGIAIEICLTSNLLCKTVKSLADHHMRYHYSLNHPIAICTDDTLPFRNSLLGEYALLLAAQPLGLGMSEEDVRLIAKMSMQNRFCSRTLQ